ncbi:hypothetical protein [Psychrosphaera aestuarii]|uniref:hypothetical protein n=1 Tax=Psychrosphaera aestuarii TaxID=1266052 RepID=UPI001B321786|nr:hypothetical protein [Psychrosphaera aestuarii]
MTAQSTPINEEVLLKQTGLMSFFVGSIILMPVISGILEATLLSGHSLTTPNVLIFIALFIGLIVSLVKQIKAGTKVDQKNYWFGNLEDEFFNHINHKAYKYSWTLSVSTLVVFSLYGSSITSEIVSINQVCQAVMGVMFFSFGLTILVKLRGNND